MSTLIKIIKKYRHSGVISFFKMKLGFTKRVKLSTLKHPIKLRPFSSDVIVFKHIFVHGDYEFDIELIPKVIIDAGANIGLASIYFANKYTQAKIYAIELAPSNYQILVKNTNMYCQVEAINAGLWHKNEMLKFKEVGASPWGYKVEKKGSENSISVQSITMDEILKKNKINFVDILKVDIEGAEVELFSHNYESWLPKVNYLVIETHDRSRPESTSTVIKALSKFDFKALGQVGENLLFKNNQL